MKLFLQKNAKFSRAWGSAPYLRASAAGADTPDPQPPASGGSDPRLSKQPPSREFLATRLFLYVIIVYPFCTYTLFPFQFYIIVFYILSHFRTF